MIHHASYFASCFQVCGLTGNSGRLGGEGSASALPLPHPETVAPLGQGPPLWAEEVYMGSEVSFNPSPFMLYSALGASAVVLAPTQACAVGLEQINISGL